MEDGLRCLLKELTKSSKLYMWRFLLRKEEEKEWDGDGKVVLPSLVRMTVALVDRAVADPAAQHHTEDHLKDHNNCDHQSGDTNQINLIREQFLDPIVATS